MVDVSHHKFTEILRAAILDHAYVNVFNLPHVLRTQCNHRGAASMLCGSANAAILTVLKFAFLIQVLVFASDDQVWFMFAPVTSDV